MPTAEQQGALRSLPQVEELLHHQALVTLLGVLPRDLVVDLARGAIDSARSSILKGGKPDCSNDALAYEVLRQTLQLEKPSLRRVVNASGVIVHTNLGRSPLPESAVAAVEEVARGYSTLEYDCAHMARGSRHDHYERLICMLTGAEAAIAVNNNAAAVMMVLAEFARGHEAVISRGELVEIGGSFRVPDIMALSGARMVEVGTTNKTHPRDYERAVGDDTALFVKVHPSNFRMSGFTESVGARELRRLADRLSGREVADGVAGVAGAADAVGAAGASGARRILVYEDLGSGALTEIKADGLRETTVREALAEGADLVSFSCDKLLGGPQAGIIVGKKSLVDALKQSPYARVLRLDKMSIAALEATLRLYLDDASARELVPTVRMLTETAEQVLPRTQAVRDKLATVLSPDDVDLSIEQDTSRAGGGALPMCDIPTYVVRVTFKRGDAQACERHLVSGRDVPVIARISNECILLDGRTILDSSEVTEVAQAFKEYFDKM